MSINNGKIKCYKKKKYNEIENFEIIDEFDLSDIITLVDEKKGDNKQFNFYKEAHRIQFGSRVL